MIPPDDLAVTRAYEYDRYLAATLAPVPVREAMIAVAAFAADLAHIVATTTQAPLGEIRLQWWRDAIASVAADQRTGRPLADSLGEAIRSHGVPPVLLAAMTEARAFDLYDDPMPDAASLDGYLGKTEAIPFELALRLLGCDATTAGSLARVAGSCYGLARLLATLPRHLSKGRTPFHAAMFDALDRDTPARTDAEQTEALRGQVVTLAGRARRDLVEVGRAFRLLPRSQRAALLPLATVGPLLDAVMRPGRDLRRDIAGLAPLTRVWRIGRAHVFGAL